MDSQSRKKGATTFAAAFAQSLSEVLTDAAGAKKQLGVIDDGRTPSSDSVPIQYRIQVEGEALNGECFVEFYESQVGSLLAELTGKPIVSLTDEHKKQFLKFIVSAVKKLESSSLTAYGNFTCKLEPVSGLSFGGMFVVPMAAPDTDPEMRVLLYFGTQLLAGFSSPSAGDRMDSPGAASTQAYNLSLVMDVELNASLRFGKRQLSLRDVLELGSGSVVELDRLVDEPVELYLDGKLIARGEAVVVDGNYGLRVTEIPQPVASQILN
jgi:flagellar motor switch protein FliN